MTDHAEEQEMEAEALTAIFDSHFEICSSSQPCQWSISLYPETGDPSELDELNHVACKLLATIPIDYPESLPELSVEIVKGLADEHVTLLEDLAREEAEANHGVPSIFAVAERLKEWLLENNVKGLDDISMHAQMMRKQKEEEKAQQKLQATFESQKEEEKFTTAELEEMAVRKRRAEGTPCTLENFLEWRNRFYQEMAAIKADETQEDGNTGKVKKKDKVKQVDKSGRITGYEHFSSKANIEALEAAAEMAEQDDTALVDEDDDEDIDDNENLFDDDVDLDDLDFDDEDDEEEEVDI